MRMMVLLTSLLTPGGGRQLRHRATWCYSMSGILLQSTTEGSYTPGHSAGRVSQATSGYSAMRLSSRTGRIIMMFVL